MSIHTPKEEFDQRVPRLDIDPQMNPQNTSVEKQ